MSTWLNSSTNVVKVNVKGMCDTSEMRGAIFYVMRDARGNWMEGCKSMIGFSFPITSELWAIYYRMKMAWEKEELTVVVETENYEDANHVLDPDPNFCFFELVIMIRNFMSETWETCELEVVDPFVNLPAAALASIAMADDDGLVALSHPQLSLRDS